jgi:predicted XRE-type DNA-binding protein
MYLFGKGNVEMNLIGLFNKKQGRPRGNYEERFWRKVNKNSGVTSPFADGECWEWTKGLFTNGYGAFNYYGKNVHSHVFSWFLHSGLWPDKLVLHKCDNRRCVRPDHLWLGTNADNMKDKKDKGRTAKEESHGSSKLTKKQVWKIHKLYREKGLTQENISLKINISRGQVSYIVDGKCWPNIYSQYQQLCIENNIELKKPF